MDLSLSGAASLNVLDGLVVLKVASFEMQLGQVSGSDTDHDADRCAGDDGDAHGCDAVGGTGRVVG